MNLKLIPTPSFIKSVKRLSKKYKKIADDLQVLQDELSSNSYKAVELGSNCFKMRIANSSIPTGQSGGFRVVFFTKIENKIYLLAIYSKSDLSNISDENILQILKENDLNKK
jgi:hypothetical protein